MKEVLRYIFEKKRAYATLPLFEWLRDERLDPRERLAFYPCMAHFILSFGDLNKFVLREEPPADVYQEMVNAHTREDDHHWPWYLEDFAELGFDVWLPPTEWMRFLWGDETEQNRRLMAGLTALARGATGVERLVIIEAIEETGNVLFGAMLPLAEVLERRLGQQLRYCGSFHFNLESGHTMGADHAELARIKLSPAQNARCRALADEVFALFEAWTHELLRYAKAHAPRAEAPAGSGTFRKAARVAPADEAADFDVPRLREAKKRAGLTRPPGRGARAPAKVRRRPSLAVGALASERVPTLLLGARRSEGCGHRKRPHDLRRARLQAAGRGRVRGSAGGVNRRNAKGTLRPKPYSASPQHHGAELLSPALLP